MKKLNCQLDITSVSIRVLDVFFVGICLLFCFPLLISLWITSLCKKESFISSYITIDCLNRPLKLTLICSSERTFLSCLLDVLKGTISFCGVEILERGAAPNKYCPDTPVKAGVFSLSGVHRLAGLAAYDSETLTLKSIQDHSVKHYLAIILKSAINKYLYRCSGLSSANQFCLFGVNIDNVSSRRAVNWVCETTPADTAKLGFFVNVNSFNLCADVPTLTSVINAADRVFPDGSGVRLGAKHQGVRLRDNVNGTDLLPLLCEKAAREGLRLYLLGASDGIARTAASKLVDQYPNLCIAGTHHGYFKKEGEQSRAIIEDINLSSTDILLVGFGSPIQEQWLLDSRDQLNVTTALAVGGLFDFFSEAIPRAPLWMRELGIEWVWRLLQDPAGKWHRYVIGNPRYLLRLWFS